MNHLLEIISLQQKGKKKSTMDSGVSFRWWWRGGGGMVRDTGFK